MVFSLTQALWQERYWVLAASAALIVGIVAYGMSDSQATDAGMPGAKVVASAAGVSGGPGTPAPPRYAPRLSEPDRARKLIAEYNEKVTAAPRAEDSPALLNAAANLATMKLGDYRQAVAYYVRILNEYPDWPFINRVYPKLAVCYQVLEDKGQEVWVYREMMKKFPPETMEYRFAEHELGLK